MILPDGWIFDGPDESVGIFGHAWSHEACPVDLDNPDADLDCTETNVGEYVEGEGVNRYLVSMLLITCNGCGLSVTVADRNWIGGDEE